MDLYHRVSSGKGLYAVCPGMERGLTLGQVLYMIVVGEHARQHINCDLVAEEGLKPEIWQAGDQSGSLVMDMAGGHARQCPTLEQGAEDIVDAASEDGLPVLEWGRKRVPFVAGERLQAPEDTHRLGCKVNQMGAGLLGPAGWNPPQAASEIEFIPCGIRDFPFPLAGENEDLQSRHRDRVGFAAGGVVEGNPQNRNLIQRKGYIARDWTSVEVRAVQVFDIGAFDSPRRLSRAILASRSTAGIVVFIGN